MDEKNYPLSSYQLGPYSVAIFENEFQNRDGSTNKSRSVTLSRVFTNKEGNSDRQKMFIKPQDVGAVIELLVRIQNDAVTKRYQPPQEPAVHNVHEETPF